MSISFSDAIKMFFERFRCLLVLLHLTSLPQINDFHHGRQHVVQLVKGDAPRLTEQDVPLNGLLGHGHAEFLGAKETEQVV